MDGLKDTDIYIKKDTIHTCKRSLVCWQVCLPHVLNLLMDRFRSQAHSPNDMLIHLFDREKT